MVDNPSSFPIINPLRQCVMIGHFRHSPLTAVYIARWIVGSVMRPIRGMVNAPKMDFLVIQIIGAFEGNIDHGQAGHKMLCVKRAFVLIDKLHIRKIIQPTGPVFLCREKVQSCASGEMINLLTVIRQNIVIHTDKVSGLVGAIVDAKRIHLQKNFRRHVVQRRSIAHNDAFSHCSISLSARNVLCRADTACLIAS